MRRLLLKSLFPVWELLRYQFWLKVVSFLIAVGLWVVVFGSRTIEITKEVPFEAVVSGDQILVDPVPEKITFRLSGPKAFLRSIMNRIDDPIRANVKDLKTGVFTQRIFSDSIKLPLGVKVLSINPNVIQMRVEELKRKSVSIHLTTQGEVAEGHKLLRTEFIPGQIRIKGPKNRIQMINSLSTVPVDLSLLRESTVIPLAFDFKSMGIDPDSTLPELYAEIQGRGPAFRVKHVPVKIQTTGKASTEVEEVMVIVRTDPDDQVKVDGEDVSAFIDVRDMPPGEYIKWIRVQLPEKVHLVRVIPSSTRVVVKGQ